MTSLNQIVTHLREGDPARADAGLRKLVKKKPNSGVDWRSAMDVAGQLANHDAALAAAQNWRAEAPADPQRIVAEITALGTVSRHKEAALLARALKDHSAAAANGYSLEAFYLARFGKRDKAIDLCRQAIALNNNHAHAWEQLAVLNGFEDLSADIDAMRRVEKNLRTESDAIALFYALARAYDAAGDYDAAFRYYSKAATIQNEAAPFDIAPVSHYLAGLKATFTEAYVARHENAGAGEGLTFILSLPRSGSTLLEQIFSTDEEIKPTGEHAILRNAALALKTLDPQTMRDADAFKQSDWRRIGLGYVDGLRRRFGASKRYTDKTLILYFYAGLIRILYPEARLVWLVRDPKDVAWSCFRSRLNGAPWSENLQSACEFVKAYDEISRYWADLFGDRLIKISYEDLIESPEQTVSSLFAHLGKTAPAGWTAFHENTNPVATNSLGQVREPLNRKGLGAWRRYEDHLAPIFEQHLG